MLYARLNEWFGSVIRIELFAFSLTAGRRMEVGKPKTTCENPNLPNKIHFELNPVTSISKNPVKAVLFSLVLFYLSTALVTISGRKLLCNFNQTNEKVESNHFDGHKTNRNDIKLSFVLVYIYFIFHSFQPRITHQNPIKRGKYNGWVVCGFSQPFPATSVKCKNCNEWNLNYLVSQIFLI